MKINLILLPIAIVALAVVTDSQGMFRRVPKVPTAQAVAPKVAQRAFSFKSNKDFSMPHMPASKVNWETIKRHKKLIAELAKSKQHESEIKKSKREQILKSLLPTVLLAGAHAIDPITFKEGALAAIGSRMIWLLCGEDVLFAELRLRLARTRSSKTVEAELAELVAEQKRQLRIPDDIQ